MPSSHERSLLETHIPGEAKEPWAALAGCRTSLLGKQMQQQGCLWCLLTLFALLLGIEQDGAGPRVPEHHQSQTILPGPGQLPQNIASAHQAAKDLVLSTSTPPREKISRTQYRPTSNF